MSSPVGLLQRAIDCHRSGRLAEAATLYREVLKSDPRQPDALHLLGLIAQHEGQLRQAIELFTSAIGAKPKVAQFHLNRGLALRADGRTAEALEDFRQAVQLEPALTEAHHQEGNALKSLGLFHEAAIALRKSITLEPQNAVLWLNLGAALLETGDLVNAETSFREAVRLEPLRPEAHNILGHTFASRGNLRAAELAYREAVRLRPDYAAAHDNLGRLLKSEARISEALDHYRVALEHAPSPATHSNLLLALNFCETATPPEVYAEHRRWEQQHALPFKPTRCMARSSAAQRRLRIGYVSPDLMNHAVAHFIEPVLASHDRAKFEIFCYSETRHPDQVTERLKSLTEHWQDTARLADDAMAELIRRDRIDILVDLAGHTAGNRLLVFARHPAPKQVTWLGYPNTTGLAAMEYRLTDAISDPVGATEAWHTEKLIRLPSSFSCYLPSPESPQVAKLPALERGFVTFGSFNQFPKLGPSVIDTWATLLRVCPAAHLLLRARSLADTSTAVRTKARFAQLGVDPARVDCDGRQLSTADHLQVYHQVDLALDPFPYNGATTTCESLWMGVPVITLAGQTHVSRVGASILTHLGASDWIAHSPDEYIQRGQTLASDILSLANIRAGLRDRFRNSPLGDATQFTQNLEAAYTGLWAQ